MRGARGRERGPGGMTGGPLLVTGGRRRPPVERGDQGWCDQETASTLGQRRRRWGTIMVHSSHGPSHGSPPHWITCCLRDLPRHWRPAPRLHSLSPGQRLVQLAGWCYAPSAVIHLNTIEQWWLKWAQVWSQQPPLIQDPTFNRDRPRHQSFTSALTFSWMQSYLKICCICNLRQRQKSRNLEWDAS